MSHLVIRGEKFDLTKLKATFALSRQEAVSLSTLRASPHLHLAKLDDDTPWHDDKARPAFYMFEGNWVILRGSTALVADLAGQEDKTIKVTVVAKYPLRNCKWIPVDLTSVVPPVGNPSGWGRTVSNTRFRPRQ